MRSQLLPRVRWEFFAEPCPALRFWIVNGLVDITARAVHRYHLTWVSHNYRFGGHVEVDVSSGAISASRPIMIFPTIIACAPTQTRSSSVGAPMCLPRLVAPIVTPCAMLTLAPKTAWGFDNDSTEVTNVQARPMMVVGEMSKPYLNRS